MLEDACRSLITQDFYKTYMSLEKKHHLIIAPDDGIEPFQEALRGAKKTLDIKMFQFSEPRLMKEVVAAHHRGVAVRVMLNPSRFTGEHDNDEAFAFFKKASVPVKETNPAYPITHEKSMVIDDERAFIMSLNWAPKYFGETRDYALVTSDCREVEEVKACFDADWNRQDFKPPVISNLTWSVGKSRESVIHFIRSAHESLYIQHEKYVDSPVIEALLEGKAKRNLTIHAMGLPVHSLRDFYRLEGIAGLRLLHDLGIHVRKLHGMHLHAKLMIADEKRALLSSFNFYPKCFNERRELGVFFDDPELIHQLVEIFKKDWENSKKIELSDESIEADLKETEEKKKGKQSLSQEKKEV
jgi:phosphatidylserine/phosphatidylglycerophosphate/cardiolipin synthase-like enzyme